MLVLGLSGSLRGDSHNSKLLRARASCCRRTPSWSRSAA